MDKYYFWVGNITGTLFSTSPSLNRKTPDRMKFMGTTSDSGWPKKMSTGRILHKPNARKQGKQMKRRLKKPSQQ